jgi:serine/threonine protein phosphatase 1
MPPRSLPTVSNGRLLAIGDIHGCLSQLCTLLDQVAPTTHDQLVFLGDYVDRGPDSAGVVETLLELRARLPHTVFLRGNHEQMLLDVLGGDDPAIFLINGGEQTIASYRKRGGWPPPAAHQDFYRNLTYSFETEKFIFVHAGLRPGTPLARQHPADLLWIRQTFLSSDEDWGKTVVFGHTPRQTVLVSKTRIGLDTGCVYGGRLTCCEVLSGHCWQSG